MASKSSWQLFETEVETWFAEFGVKVLHAKDLHNTDGEFAGWTVLRKQAFVARLCQAMSHHLPLGVSMSTLKEVYAARAVESDRKRTVTPYTFCFQVINDWILRDIRVGRAANTEGLAYVIEAGNEHNAEAEEQFYAVRELHSLEGVLTSIRFFAKESCRAIQMADLIAFYSRRHGEAMEKSALTRACRNRSSSDDKSHRGSRSNSLLCRDRFWSRSKRPTVLNVCRADSDESRCMQDKNGGPHRAAATENGQRHR